MPEFVADGPENDIDAVLPGSEVKVMYILETGSPELRDGGHDIPMVASILEDISNS
jgi:hypothetical protein